MNIFCLDAETDGLYGEAFAIAAVVLDECGNLVDSFAGQANANAVKDEWVIENVLERIKDLPMYTSRQLLREAFWSFWIKHRATSVCIADVTYPVESGLFRQCIESDLKNRMWLGPFPLIDVSSIFAAFGHDPLTDRLSFSGYGGSKHNPFDDAMASSICYLKLIAKTDKGGD
ncbi:MAG: hypothetical protein FWG10_01210 [Eubacteriaceae bacterium]|nr:hypothetical protein [Eubacteriaceae bacterium]